MMVGDVNTVAALGPVLEVLGKNIPRWRYRCSANCEGREPNRGRTNHPGGERSSCSGAACRRGPSGGSRR